MQDDHYRNYSNRLQAVLEQQDWQPVDQLGRDLQVIWANKRRVFLCGNGGSAANAIHIANDFMYGASCEEKTGLNVHALPANQAVLTCLANDLSYEDVYSHQISVFGRQKDLLIVLSGSGNSPNILRALEQAKVVGLKSYAILGYSGGKALEMADVAIHFPIDDMQIAEDCQLVVGHMLMRWLVKNGKGQAAVET